MTTRAKTEDVFKHVMNAVLGFQDTDPIMLAMHESQYDNINDIVTMSEEEIMDLKYPDGGTEKLVPMKLRKKLLHLLWWRDLEASKQSSGTVSIEDWNALTEEVYDSFRSVHAANRARGNGTVGMGVTSTNAVTQEKVVAFQKGHKRDRHHILSSTANDVVGFVSKETGVLMPGMTELVRFYLPHMLCLLKVQRQSLYLTPKVGIFIMPFKQQLLVAKP